MNKYHCVRQRYYDNGNIDVIMYTVWVKGDKPQNTSVARGRYDIYCDYFDTISEAEAFMQKAKKQGGIR